MSIIAKAKFVSIVSALTTLTPPNLSLPRTNVWNRRLRGTIINVSDNAPTNGVRLGPPSMLLTRLSNKNIVMYIMTFSLMPS